MPTPAEQWMKRANCRGADPSLFVPKEEYSPSSFKGRARILSALEYCDNCEVTEECREYARTMRNSYGLVYGVWGGQYFDGKKRRRNKKIA